MVVVFSSNANASDHIRREVERAVGHGIPVVPVRIENVMPQGDLEYFLSASHWMDAITPPLEKHFDELAGKLRSLLQIESKAPVTSVPSRPAPINASAKRSRRRPILLGAGSILIIAAAVFMANRWHKKSQEHSTVIPTPPTATVPANLPPANGPSLTAQYQEFQNRAKITWANSFFVDHAPKQFEQWEKLAKADDPIAQFFTGFSLLQGVGVKMDPAAGFDWISKSARQGNPDAMYMVGLCMHDGLGVQKDPTGAYRWFKDAADAGQTHAMLAVLDASSWLRSTTQPSDAPKLITSPLMTRACEAGDLDAQYARAMMKLFEMVQTSSQAAADAFNQDVKQIAASGEPGCLITMAGKEKDPAKAKEMFLRALKTLGDPQAVAKITQHGFLELFNPPNVFPDLTMQRLEEIAAAGSGNAMKEIGDIYNAGTQPYRKSPLEAVRWYLKAADAGASVNYGTIGDIYAAQPAGERDMNAAIAWWIKAGDDSNFEKAADAYAKGDGVPQDVPKAIVYWEKAKNFWTIGEHYAKGDGIEKSLDEALKWFTKAGEQNTYFKAALGNLYLQGTYFPKEIDKAVYWYERAANEGDANAMAWLGTFYRDGTGKPQDATQAVHWFLKGAVHSDASATQCLAAMLRNGNGIATGPPAVDYASVADDLVKLASKPDTDVQVKVAQGAKLIGATAGSDPLWNSLAAWCFYEAALSDDPVAMREYAKLLDSGIDISNDGQSPNSSAHWWALAADKGDPEALAHLGRSK